MSDKSIIKIKTEQFAVDWNGILNSNYCNENFDNFCVILTKTMDKICPIVNVCISAK